MAAAVTTAAQGNGAYQAVNVTTGAAVKLEQVTVNRKNITIQNLGPNPIYVGFDNAVTTTTGFQVPANGGSLAMDVANGTAIWARSATADQTSPNNTRVLEFR